MTRLALDRRIEELRLQRENVREQLAQARIAVKRMQAAIDGISGGLAECQHWLNQLSEADAKTVASQG